MWEGEPGGSGLNGSPGQLTWSLPSHVKAFELYALGRTGTGPGECHTEIGIFGRVTWESCGGWIWRGEAGGRETNNGGCCKSPGKRWQEPGLEWQWLS